MSMRRVSCLVAVSVLFAMAGALAPLGAPAAAAPLSRTIRIPIAGIVNSPVESVALSGSADILSTLVLDPLLFEPPRELVTINLVDVAGVGLTTGRRYVASGQDTLLRVLVTSDTVEVAFPFFPDAPGGMLQARSALASFRLSFDLVTGTLTGGTAAFSTPPSGQ